MRPDVPARALGRPAAAPQPERGDRVEAAPPRSRAGAAALRPRASPRTIYRVEVRWRAHDRSPRPPRGRHAANPEQSRDRRTPRSGGGLGQRTYREARAVSQAEVALAPMRCAVVGLGWAAGRFPPARPRAPSRAPRSSAAATPAAEQRAVVARRPGSRRSSRSTSCSSARDPSRGRRHAARLARRALPRRRSRRAPTSSARSRSSRRRGGRPVLAAAERPGRRVAVNHEFREKPIFRAVSEPIGTAGRRPPRLLPDLAAHGPRAVGRAGGLARGDAEPHALRGRRASRRPACCPLRRAARSRLRAALERPRPRARGRRDPPRDARVPRRPARRRSRSTGCARPGRATSSSAPTASTRRCGPRTAGARCCRPG